MSRHNNDSSRQILPPASYRNSGGFYSRQTGTTNHGVSLPPIQNNNKVTNRNSETTDLSRQTPSKNQQDPYPKNRGYTNNDDNNHCDKNNNARYSNKETDNKKYDKTTDKSQEHSSRRSRSRSPKRADKGTNDNKTKKTNHYDIDRYESSQRQKQRSRSTDRERSRHSKSGENEYRNSSSSRYRQSRSRSKSRDGKKTRKSSRKTEYKHRSQSNDRKYTPRSQSRDRGSRRRSKSRDRYSRNNDRRKRSRSRDRHSTIRHKSRSTSGHSKRGKSRSKSRHSECHRYRSKSRERNERRKRKDEYYRSASRSPPRERKNEQYKSKTKSLSDNTLNRRSKTRDFRHGKSSRPSSSEYYTKEKRKSKHSKSRTPVYESDSCTSESDIEISNLSRKASHKRLVRPKQKIRLSKPLTKKNKSKVRRGSVSDSEHSYKYNLILIDESDDSEEDQPSNQAFYVRSKSQHAVPRKARRHKVKEYYSDIESSDRQRAVIYNEPDKVIVAPRNTLDVPRTIQHVHTVGTSQQNQQEKELFYLVPASQHTVNNSQYSQDNALFDADVGRRVVHMSQPIQNSRNQQQLYYLNNNDSVYGQDPLYDEYRQPAQQKYYNQHTNHYRHNNSSENVEQKYLYRQNAVKTDLSINQQNMTVKGKQNQISKDNSNQNQKLSMPKTTVEANKPVQSSRITPDGQSNSSNGYTPSTFDENESRMSSRDENRISTAERRKALRQLNDISNYNIDLALGKAPLPSPPMTDETLIKKIFNAEFQSEMDDYLRS